MKKANNATRRNDRIVYEISFLLGIVGLTIWMVAESIKSGSIPWMPSAMLIFLLIYRVYLFVKTV